MVICVALRNVPLVHPPPPPSSSSDGGSPGAGGGSYFPTGNQYSIFTNSLNGGLPGRAGSDGYVSIFCLKDPPASPSASPGPELPPSPINTLAVGIGVAAPIALLCFGCLGAMLWAGGPRLLAAKIAGRDLIAPVDGSTRAARRAAAAGVDLVAVAMTRDEAAALGVMTMAVVGGSRRGIKGGASPPKQAAGAAAAEKSAKRLAEEAAARDLQAARDAARAGAAEVRSTFSPGRAVVVARSTPAPAADAPEPGSSAAPAADPAPDAPEEDARVSFAPSGVRVAPKPPRSS